MSDPIQEAIITESSTLAPTKSLHRKKATSHRRSRSLFTRELMLSRSTSFSLRKVAVLNLMHLYNLHHQRSLQEEEKENLVLITHC